MSTVPPRPPALPLLATATAGAAAGLLALGLALARESVLLAPALVLALVAVPVVLGRPLLAVLALAVEDAMNLGAVLGGLGIRGVHLALLAVALASLALAVARGRLPVRGSPVLACAALYLGVQALAGLLAGSPGESVTAVFETGKDIVLLAVVGTVMAGSRGAGTLARVLVASVASLALLSVVQQVLGNATTFWGLSNVPLGGDIGSVTARHSGPQLDANFWGRVLVLVVPLAMALAAGARRRTERVGWLGALAALLAGIYLTGSRGTLLALLAAAACWLLLAGPRYRRLLLLSPALLLVLAVPGVGSRLATLTELSASSASLSRPDPSLQGRRTAQAAGLHMVEEHPLTGVGPGRFVVEMPDYQRRYALAESPPLAPHDLYLQQAAEGGLPLLMAWLTLLGSAVFSALRAKLLLLRRGAAATSAALLADGVLASLAGWSVASLFLHLATFRTLLLVMAIGVGLDGLARRQAAHGQDA